MVIGELGGGDLRPCLSNPVSLDPGNREGERKVLDQNLLAGIKYVTSVSDPDET